MTETGLARVQGFGLALQPTNMNEAMHVAGLLAKSQLCPAAYRGKPDEVVIACAMGARLGLDPFAAMSGISVINGRASLWGDAMVAVAMQHPQFRGIKTVKSGEVAKGTFAVEVTALRDHGAGLIEYVGSFSQTLSLIHISEPTRPY